MRRVGPRSAVRLGVAVLLLAPSDGLVARGVCATQACRASCRAPPALTVVALCHRSEARTESTGNAGAGGIGRTLGALALALMLIVPPGALPAVADPAPACKEFASSCRAATGQQAKPADQPERSPAAATSQPAKAASRRYINLTGFPFPLGPFTERRTVATELVPGRVYGFEQEQMLSGITANVRSVVFRMKDNHLLVYNPVAPTDEFLQQLDALQSDGVSHVMLGATAYEHKIFVGPFARRFPAAKVWAVPGQWSFPLNLPAAALGIDTAGTGGGELTDTAAGSAAYAAAPDLTSEFEVKLLRPAERLGLGYAANEAALFHKETGTLAITDALVNVPAKPPEIYDRSNLRDIGDNGRNTFSLGNIILKALGAVNWQGSGANEVEALFAASDQSVARGGSCAMSCKPSSSVKRCSSCNARADVQQVQRGWERNTLLSLYFGPSPKTLVDPSASFNSLRGKWVVAPVTDALIYRSDRVKPELTRWVDDVARWDFKTIAPAHFDAGPGTAEELKAAFAPTLAPEPRAERAPYDAADVRLLDDIATQLIKLKVI